MENTVELLNRGMQCLTEHMGIVEAERFISIIIREKFDYTQWQRQYFDAVPTGDFGKAAAEYAKAHPYTGGAEQL